MAKKTKTISLRQCFAELQDPRREHGRLHNLWDILALTILAGAAGADTWVEVEQYGYDKLPFLRTFLELPNGIPSHDTLARVFALLDPAAFRQGFLTWTAALFEASDGRFVAIDGKTLRRSFDTAAGKAALHLVSAWASENRLVLGQQAVDSHSNEITAIPELLRLLDLSGAIVTIDAMGCQKDIAAQIVTAGGDYVLALKENHEALFDDVQEIFTEGLDHDFADIEHHRHQTTDKGHGRVEARTYHVVPVPEELLERHPEWEGLRTLGMVFSERQVGDEEATCETRFFLSSLAPKVKTFARAVRGHWGIENGLHWVLDVSFREDESRLRKGHGPENLGLVRRLTASLLQQETTAKGGVACKRKHAGWDNDYLLEVLGVSLR
jgi:predicted transposase YbfD/YdcC